MKKIKLLVVEDHHLIRDSIKALLSAYSDIKIVGEAADGEEAVEKTSLLQPDVVVMDISMPKLNGLRATQLIKEESAEVKIVLLSAHVTQKYVIEGVKVGADGYIPKESSTSVLIDAIRTVYDGKKYYKGIVSDMIVENYTKKSGRKGLDDAPEKKLPITKREMEILKLISNGMTNQEIAEKLFISVRTVESHKSHIMQKLDIKNTAGLVKFAFQNNLAL